MQHGYMQHIQYVKRCLKMLVDAEVNVNANHLFHVNDIIFQFSAFCSTNLLANILQPKCTISDLSSNSSIPSIGRIR